MAHEVGVQRQETIKRGCLAARALIESGMTDWSPEAITAHLKANEPKRSAAWFRGFLAYLLVNEITTDEDAGLVLSALNPGHWTTSGVSNAYFEFVQEFSDSLGPLSVHLSTPADDADIDSHFEFAVTPEQPAPDEDDPERAELAAWLSRHFAGLSAERSSMLDAFASSLLEPSQRAISGNWPEALLRASQALAEKDWRVSIADSMNDLETAAVIDWNDRSIVLPAPNADAAHILLCTLGKLCLQSNGSARPMADLHADVASELAGSLAGWALGANFIGASLHHARSMMLSSDQTPRLVYKSCFDATIDSAAELLDLLGIEPSALSH
jgi:hypothetical protein